MANRPCSCCHNGVNLWTPERIQDHLRRGKLLPHDWRQILENAGIRPPDTQLSFDG